MTAQNENNGRIKMAVVMERLDVISDQLGKIVDKVDVIEERLHTMEVSQASSVAEFGSELRRHCRRLDSLEQKSDRWDWINSIGAIIAGLIAAILGLKP